MSATPSAADFWEAVERGKNAALPPWLAPLAAAAVAEAAFESAAPLEALERAPLPGAPWEDVRELLLVRLAHRGGQHGQLEGLLHRVERLSVHAAEASTRARALHTLGVLQVRRGQHASAEHTLHQALALAGDGPLRLWILDTIGQCYQGQAAWAEARHLLRAVGALKERAGDAVGTAISAGNLALLELGLGRDTAAESAARDALERVGKRLPGLTRLRLLTLLVQSQLATSRATQDARRLQQLLEEQDGTPHPLKAWAALALARANPSEANPWLKHAERHFTAPADLALVHYWRLQLFPQAPRVVLDRVQLETALEKAPGDSEAKLLAHLYWAERATQPPDIRYHLDEAYQCALRANNPLWMDRVDRANEQLDLRAFQLRIMERFTGRGQSDLQRTTQEEATVLFADLDGFSARAHALGPEEALQTVTSVFELAVPLFVEFRVRPLQYQGDGLLAVCQGGDHARRGLGFAEALVARTARASTIRRALGGSAGLTVRAGVAAGPTLFGILGSQYKLEYQALGRAVELSRHLRDRARPGEVVTTLDCARSGGVPPQDLEELRLAGDTAPLQLTRLRVAHREG